MHSLFKPSIRDVDTAKRAFGRSNQPHLYLLRLHRLGSGTVLMQVLANGLIPILCILPTRSLMGSSVSTVLQGPEHFGGNMTAEGFDDPCK